MAEHGLNRPFFTALQRALRVEKFVTLLLLFILLTAAAAGVTAVLTGPDWASLWVSLLVGLLVGWALAIFGWPAWRSALLVIVVGVLFSLLFAGALDVKIGALVGETFRLVASLPAGYKTHQVDSAPLAAAWQQLALAVNVVLSRVVAWVSSLAGGQAAFDPVAAGVIWSLVVWLISAWAGWVVEARRGALIAILPALSLNLATLSYGRRDSVTIYLMLGLTLVLIAVVHFDQRKQEWDATRVAYPQRKGRQVGNASVLIAIGLVLLAAFISSLSLQRIAQWTAEINRSSSQSPSGLAKSLGIQQPTAVPNSFSQVRAPGLPRNLLIGASPQLLEEQVMTVAVTDLSSLVHAGQLPPLYWRSYTYDVYTGHGWSASPTNQAHYAANQAIQSGSLPGHVLIQESFNPLPGQGGTVYAAGEPVSLNIAATAAWRSSNDLFGIQAGDSGYTVQSLVPVASADSLRAAGTAYPFWVTQRYLVVPSEVPNRVRALALQLTATQPTPYDRAHAIEEYLRTTYPYTLDVPYPPASQDLADYFLFDLRKGYCDYYASAMVVLSRSAGLPARLAVGYASGTYNPSSKRFIVTQAEAHSWVEIYFPNIGWVPFEPTAANPAINRSGQPLSLPTPPATPITAAPHPTPPAALELPGGYIALGALLVAIFGWAGFDELYLHQLSARQAAVEIYRRLQRYGRWFALPAELSQTPGEYGLSLADNLSGLEASQASPNPKMRQEVVLLIQRIVRLGYRPSEAGEASRIALLRQWRRVRWQLRLAWLRWLWSFGRRSLHDDVIHYMDDGDTPFDQE